MVIAGGKSTFGVRQLFMTEKFSTANNSVGANDVQSRIQRCLYYQLDKRLKMEIV